MDQATGRPVQDRSWYNYSTDAEYRAVELTPQRSSRRLAALLVLLLSLTAALFGAQILGYLDGTPLARAGVQPGYPSPSREEESSRLLPVPVVAPPSSSYAFLNTDDAGLPIAWSPCRPIHYVVNPEHASPETVAAVLSALPSISAATGLQFISDGTTDLRPAEHEVMDRDRYGNRWAPVLISFATNVEEPDFVAPVAAHAGPSVAVGDHSVYVTGIATFAAEKFATYDSATAQSIAIHEFGHLVGLDHVSDTTQIMAPTGSHNGLQSGDLTGLAALGAGPCAPEL